eukprot:7316564-Prymnesium_polylepis.2
MRRSIEGARHGCTVGAEAASAGASVVGESWLWPPSSTDAPTTAAPAAASVRGGGGGGSSPEVAAAGRSKAACMLPPAVTCAASAGCVALAVPGGVRAASDSRTAGHSEASFRSSRTCGQHKANVSKACQPLAKRHGWSRGGVRVAVASRGGAALAQTRARRPGRGARARGQPDAAAAPSAEASREAGRPARRLAA